MIEELTGKRVLVVVAHYDDETLYAGGLLWELREKARLYILCCSHTAVARRHKMEAAAGYVKVGDMLGAATFNLNCGGGKKDKRPDKKTLKENISLFVTNKDAIITHNAKGEYHGHVYHKEVYAACRPLFTSVRHVYTFANGIEYTEKVAYDVEAKKRLVDCYLPWKPGAYRKFVWKKERFKKIK